MPSKKQPVPRIPTPQLRKHPDEDITSLRMVEIAYDIFPRIVELPFRKVQSILGNNLKDSVFIISEFLLSC